MQDEFVNSADEIDDIAIASSKVYKYIERMKISHNSKLNCLMKVYFAMAAASFVEPQMLRRACEDMLRRHEAQMKALGFDENSETVTGYPE